MQRTVLFDKSFHLDSQSVCMIGYDCEVFGSVGTHPAGLVAQVEWLWWILLSLIEHLELPIAILCGDPGFIGQ